MVISSPWQTFVLHLCRPTLSSGLKEPGIPCASSRVCARVCSPRLLHLGSSHAESGRDGSRAELVFAVTTQGHVGAMLLGRREAGAGVVRGEEVPSVEPWTLQPQPHGLGLGPSAPAAPSRSPFLLKHLQGPGPLGTAQGQAGGSPDTTSTHVPPAWVDAVSSPHPAWAHSSSHLDAQFKAHRSGRVHTVSCLGAQTVGSWGEIDTGL